MTDEQFSELIKSIQAGKKVVPAAVQVPRGVLDAIPLPMGWKAIIGLLGALITAGGSQVGLIDASSQWVELAIYAFSALGGLGLIAKFDRLIQIAVRVLGYAPTVIALLERLESEAKKAEQKL